MEQAKSAREIWEATLGELQVQVSKQNYRTWLEKTTGLDYRNGEFVVGVPNAFVAAYLEQNQSSLIQKTLISRTQQVIKVTFQVYDAQITSPSRRRDNGASAPALNPQYTFDSFIAGNTNKWALDASKQIATNPGRYNPLVIYGKSGLGKTHLLQAIGHAAMERQMNVLYVSAEQFTNDYVNTVIKENNSEKFFAKYRNVDMLLLDDIRFFTKKVGTQESFLHTFNELHNKNRQITISSDCPPQDMKFLDERLSSRLGGGLVAELKSPDRETSMSILRAKAQHSGEDISDDVLDLIARRIHQNIRELEGSLNAVIAYARLLNTKVTPEIAAQVQELGNAKTGQTNALYGAQLLIATVADSFRLTPDDLIGKKRDKEVTLARHVAVYLLKEVTNFSLGQIGKELGGRNASTITRAYERISTDIEANASLRRKIRDIEQQIPNMQKPH